VRQRSRRRAGEQKRILILVQNLSVPFEGRVWQEDLALTAAGCQVVVICPAGAGRDTQLEVRLDAVRILRYPLQAATGGPAGCLREFGLAPRHTLWPVPRVRRDGTVHAVQACSPPDPLFLPVLPLQWTGAKLVCDHHDLATKLFRSCFPGGGAAPKPGGRAGRADHVRAGRRRGPHEPDLPAGGADPRLQGRRGRAGGAQRAGPRPGRPAQAGPRARAGMCEVGRPRVAEQVSWATSRENLASCYRRLRG
jgi:hypothetical protein